jgi:sulfite exporter TauE/SafE/copper chaperone CopZ/plastocyanin
MAMVEVQVRGMTCTACETRISGSLGEVPGVVGVDVSTRLGRARIRTDGQVSTKALHHAIRAAGYDVGPDEGGWLSRDPRVWREVVVAIGVLAVIALTLQAAGVTTLADRAGAVAGSGGLALVVVLGLAAGLSTCMALVGGLVLAVSARFAEQHRDLTPRQRLRPQLAFNAGRLVGFAVLGAFVGLAGSAVSLNGRGLAVLMIGVSLAMGALGLRLTHLSPRLSSASTITLPAGLANRLGIGRAVAGYSDGRAALLGAGTFLLPCGFTQAVQVYAMSTGSPWRASVIMTLFALGTLPGLLGVGTVTALARGAFATSFFRFAGVAVMVFAVLNISGALSILVPGLGAPAFATGSQAGAGQTVGADSSDPASLVSANVTLGDGNQVLRTTQDADGYEPDTATVLAGVPIEWQIDSVAIGCASSLYAPDLGLESMVLDSGVNTLTLTLEEPGTYSYSCGMGMYKGTITAVAAPPLAPRT